METHVAWISRIERSRRTGARAGRLSEIGAHLAHTPWRCDEILDLLLINSAATHHMPITSVVQALQGSAAAAQPARRSRRVSSLQSALSLVLCHPSDGGANPPRNTFTRKPSRIPESYGE